jgi:hypothetical protein
MNVLKLFNHNYDSFFANFPFYGKAKGLNHTAKSFSNLYYLINTFLFLCLREG